MWSMILPAVILGFLLDLIIGDPRWLYHPVRIIGKEIVFFEKILRKLLPEGKRGERTGGILLVILVTGVTTGVVWLILYLLYGWNQWAGFLLETFWCYQILATRSLKVESMRVYEALKTKDLEKSRRAVSMIVGRDTSVLDETGVTKAAVETVAENTSDGIIAPLIFLIIGGAVGGFFYKSINTMDSMVGYKNEKYQYFGTAAAKLDDVVNYIPARLSGVFMVLAAGFTGMDRKNAWKIFLRDRYNHASPNSAQTEAVMAGALDVELAGDAWYFGVLHKKKTIGDPIRQVEPEDIPRANRLMYGTAILTVAVLGALRFVLVRFLIG